MPQNSYKCRPLHSVQLGFTGAGQEKVPRGNGPLSTQQHPSSPCPSPWHPALVFIVPFATRDRAAAALLSSFPPVLPPPLSTMIQQVFIRSFAPSAAQILNMKKARAPALKQKYYLGYAATAEFTCIKNLK